MSTTGIKNGSCCNRPRFSTTMTDEECEESTVRPRGTGNDQIYGPQHVHDYVTSGMTTQDRTSRTGETSGDNILTRVHNINDEKVVIDHVLV